MKYRLKQFLSATILTTMPLVTAVSCNSKSTPQGNQENKLKEEEFKYFTSLPYSIYTVVHLPHLESDEIESNIREVLNIVNFKNITVDNWLFNDRDETLGYKNNPIVTIGYIHNEVKYKKEITFDSDDGRKFNYIPLESIVSSSSLWGRFDKDSILSLITTKKKYQGWWIYGPLNDNFNVSWSEVKTIDTRREIHIIVTLWDLIKEIKIEEHPSE